MKYLITGSNGQLAREFIKKLENENIFSFDLDKLDITNEKDVREAIEAIKPDILINCAAYNNVDKAEIEYEKAYRVNALSLKNFAIFCEKYKTKIIHFSTDFVFPGRLEKTPYTENDMPSPINKYGKSKLEGERILSANYENYSIFRVSWLYGEGTQNFPYKLRVWAKDRKQLKIADDEISVPTPTKFVAQTALKALDLNGIWHLCCDGFASRYEWALEIAKKDKLSVEILPAKQNDFSLPAKRPCFSAMSSIKLSEKLGIKFPNWKEFYE